MTTCAIRSQATCLPVTALKSIQHDGNALLFAGHGPNLHVYTDDGVLVLSKVVFEVQPILGIQTCASGDDLLIAIWGGPCIKLGWATADGRNGAAPQIRLSEQLDCRDWILDAAFHQHSLFVLTAHNQLLEVGVAKSFNGDRLGDGGVSVLNGPRSFLYAGCVSVSSKGSMIVASGTVFGEILVWTCSRRQDDQNLLSSSLKHVFNGHSGSVFGVSISENFDLRGNPVRLLASCSDDRTVRIWDISDCDDDRSGSTNGNSSTDTGFGHESHVGHQQIASAWGHLSRIWGVEFVNQREPYRSSGLPLLSRGEDGACQLWSIEIREQLMANTVPAAVLKPLLSDRHHFGKNAWSMSQSHTRQGLVVYTGGADGRIISRRLGTLDSKIPQSLMVSTPFREITASSFRLKHYLLLRDDECLATTDQGHLFRLNLLDEKLQWHHLIQPLEKSGLLLCSAEGQEFTLFGNQRGQVAALLKGEDNLVPLSPQLSCGISWLQVAGQRHEDLASSKTCFVAVLADKRVVLLWASLCNGSIHLSQTALVMPETFTITACCYDSSSEFLLLGSRAGAIAIYAAVTPESQTLETPFCLRHVHGTDSVTSINFLRHHSDVQEAPLGATHILTTGRDGNYTVQRISGFSPMTVDEPLVVVVHMSAPPFGPSIEGAYIRCPTGISCAEESDLLLYGFRSTSFVAWNEPQQSEILSVDCGGSHRSWSFKDYPTSANSSATSFVWTKAGRLNWHRANGVNHKVVRRGGHGREIKALTHSPSLLSSIANGPKNRHLLATGAEDTDIQLFMFSTVAESAKVSERGDRSTLDDNTVFQSVALLKGHTTGLQHLQFSPSGKYVFSSAGCEEFYVWKLSFDIPCIGVGAVLWDVMPNGEESSDARIMCFDARCTITGSEHDEQDYRVVMAYSSGKTKVIRYITGPNRNQGTFETLREIDYGSVCVMQALFLPPELAGSVGSRERILSAGTNGFLDFSHIAHPSTLDHQANTIQAHLRTEVHKVHQNSILAMKVAYLGPDTYLIATGGDDNALGLSLLTFPSPPCVESKDDPEHDGQATPKFRAMLIPNAHAAALTALDIIDVVREPTRFSTMVVTSGNDQRVKVWRVDIDLQKMIGNRDDETEDDNLVDAVQVELVGGAWTSVADVSGLEIIDGLDDANGLCGDSGGRSGLKCRVVVVGVGMELISIECSQG